MKSDKKYILILGLIFVGFIAFQLWGPKPLNWTPTYLPSDKDPFGNYILNEVLTDIFPGQKISRSNFTFYELEDSISGHENILSVSDEFAPDKEAVKVLLDKVSKGANAFISASRFRGLFRDTLHLATKDILFERGVDFQASLDTTYITLGDSRKRYYYQSGNIPYYFNTDSLRKEMKIVARNSAKKPITLYFAWGAGTIVLNSTPLAFTNNYIVSNENHHVISSTLSYLPVEKIWWTSYYQVGRLESSSPLRYILKTDSLRWAYYLTICSLLLFILFEGKRKQRMIPIVTPLANSTLEFVTTIGNLYWESKDYKTIAQKKILFFMDRIRAKYYLTHEPDDRLAQLLAKKTGKTPEETQKLFSLMKVIQNSPAISAEMLLDLTREMDTYNYKN